MNNVYYIFKNICTNINTDIVLLIVATLSLCLFILLMCLKHLGIVSRKKCIKTEASYHICTLIVFLMFMELKDTDFKQTFFYTCIFILETALFFTFIISEPREKEKVSAQTVIKLTEPDPVIGLPDIQRIKCMQKKEEIHEEIDFSHVKNLIERLEFADINQSEKKEVKELKQNVLYAEKYGIDKNNKQKINDGLGILLKIMARYNI